MVMALVCASVVGIGLAAEVARDGRRGAADRHRRHRRQLGHAALHLRRRRADRRHRHRGHGDGRVRPDRDRQESRGPADDADHPAGEDHGPDAAVGGPEDQLRADTARQLHRFHLRAAARPRRHDQRVHVLHGGEEAREGPVALRQGRDRRRGRAGKRQQRVRADDVRADADAGHTRQRIHGADAGGDDDPRHRSRARRS